MKKRRKKGELAKLKIKLWDLCREITRARYGNSCYTCPKKGLAGGNWQTGHYVTSSTCSVEVRYDLRNLRPQCYHCNINLSGNPHQYRENLVRDEGIEYVEELWERNKATKGKVYPTQWFHDKIAEYSILV